MLLLMRRRRWGRTRLRAPGGGDGEDEYGCGAGGWFRSLRSIGGDVWGWVHMPEAGRGSEHGSLDNRDNEEEEEVLKKSMLLSRELSCLSSS